MKRFLMALAFLLPLNTSALTPGEVQAIVQQAQESVQTLPQTQEEDIAIVIAVSLSMPRASLLKLGQDARDAGLALTFRGVGTEIKNKPDEMEIVLTGRNANPKIIEIAHLVSEIKPVKHYWDTGIAARKGIEY